MLETLWINLQNPVHAFGFGVATTLGCIAITEMLYVLYNSRSK